MTLSLLRQSKVGPERIKINVLEWERMKMHSLRYLDDDGLHKRMMETLSEYLYFL